MPSVGIGAELVVPSRSFPQESSLIQIPLTNVGGGSFGLAVIHKGSRAVPYWMQVSITAEGHAQRRQAHVLSRSVTREHRSAIAGLELWRLLDFLSPCFDLVLGRAGLASLVADYFAACVLRVGRVRHRRPRSATLFAG
jgi:hypothetical protein